MDIIFNHRVTLVIRALILKPNIEKAIFKTPVYNKSGNTFIAQKIYIFKQF